MSETQGSESMLSGEQAPVEQQTEVQTETQTETQTEGVANMQQSEESSSRPEWLPEKFNSPEDFAKSYSELESKIGVSRDTVRDELMKEIETEAFADRPEKASMYEVPEDMPQDFVEGDMGFLDFWSEVCWENGWSNEEFQAGMREFSKFIEPPQDLDAERGKLGDNANQRIEAVRLWANQSVPAELQDEVLRVGQTGEGVMLLEYLMSQSSKTNVMSNASAPAQISETDVKSMMNDPRYYDVTKRDPAYVKQVDEAFKRLYK